MSLPANEIAELAVLALSPIVKDTIDELGKGAIKRAGADIYDTLKAHYQKFWQKDKNNSKLGEKTLDLAFEQLKSTPEDESVRMLLIEKITTLLETDKELAQTLSEIVEPKQALIKQLVSISGSVANSVVVNGNHNTVNKNTVVSILKRPAVTGKASNIPRGSQTFVGREETLNDLHSRLSQSQSVAITAIHGMCGIGKTELARQYAVRYADSYPGGCCWLRARNSDTIAAQVIEYAQVQLGLPAPPDELDTLSAQVAYCWRRWPQLGKALVVVDDATDYKQIVDVLPPEEARFCVLMTTRQTLLAADIESFEIDVLTEEEALLLLQQIVGCLRVNNELEIAKQLCEWLGYLPLAIELVAQYLKRKPDISLSTLQERLDAQRLEARALTQMPDGMTAQLSVIEAFELSWQILTPEAQQLACLLSLFALSPIPWQLVATQVSKDEEEDVEDARDLLIELSLLQRVEKNVYQLHQLVKEYFSAKLAQHAASEDMKQTYCQMIVSACKRIPSNHQTRVLTVQIAQIIPHAIEVVMSWLDWLDSKELIQPFATIKDFYVGQSKYREAEIYCTRCVSFTSSHLGSEHPIVATSLNYLAEIYLFQGRYGEAEPLFQQALEIDKAILGENHINIAVRLNNIATLYQSQGRYGEAELLFQQSLEMYKEVVDKKHPTIAMSLNNIAMLYVNQGRYNEAEPLHRQALEMYEALLGEQHLDVAKNLNNLATLYQLQGRYSEAEPLFERALEIRRALLDEQHHDIAIGLNNLAMLHVDQGRYSKAEPLYKQALEIYKVVLGEQHPDIAKSLNNLAMLYLSQGRYSEAKPLCAEALKMDKALLGEQHPSVAKSLNNLAMLHVDQGRYSKAEPLYKQALEIYKVVLGGQHPDIAMSLNNLAMLHGNQGRYDEAEPLYKQALEMNKALLGEQHPSIAMSLNNLAMFYDSQGRYDEAEPLYKQALEMHKALLGEQHPSIAMSLNNLAMLYGNQGRYSEAEPLYKQALEMHKALLGEQHPSVATNLSNLAMFYDNQGRYNEAELLHQQALDIRKAVLGECHPDTASSFLNLATIYYQQQRYTQALNYIQQALTIYRITLDDEHPTTQHAVVWYKHLQSAVESEVSHDSNESSITFGFQGLRTALSYENTALVESDTYISTEDELSF